MSDEIRQKIMMALRECDVEIVDDDVSTISSDVVDNIIAWASSTADSDISSGHEYYMSAINPPSESIDELKRTIAKLKRTIAKLERDIDIYRRDISIVSGVRESSVWVSDDEVKIG